MAEADRQRGQAGGEPVGQQRPQRRHLRLGDRARIARPGPHHHQVVPVERGGPLPRPDVHGETQGAELVGQHPVKVSSPSTISARRPVSPASLVVPGTRSSSQNRASDVFRAASTARTSGSSASGCSGSRCGARRAEPEQPLRTARAGSAAGASGASPSAASTPAALACVSATSPAAVECRTRVAPTGTRSSPAGEISAVRIRIGASSVCRPAPSRPSRASTPE